MRHGQSRWRFAVFMAVLGLHILAVLLLFAAGRMRLSHVALGESLSLLWISEKNPPQRPAAAAAAMPELKRKQTLLDMERLPDVAVSESGDAITLPSDLATEADATARQQADNDEKERRWRNLAGPSQSQLQWSKNNAPLIRDYHQRNDIEHAEGGEIITWMNDKCFYTTHGISTLGLPQTSMVCKDPPKPETDLFRDMRKRLDDSAKGSAP